VRWGAKPHQTSGKVLNPLRSGHLSNPEGAQYRVLQVGR
jgi:hypothetical protein